jgi:DNA replicative helicase MCM subunit Mcm2 (Cdc46/Mcm family)
MWQRFVYAAVYRCVDCGQKQARRRSTFTFSRVSLCPRCGTEKLRVRRKRDQIDKMSTSMVSRVQHILGGELHHCEFCRLQFYDFRKVAADNHRKS